MGGGYTFFAHILSHALTELYGFFKSFLVFLDKRTDDILVDERSTVILWWHHAPYKEGTLQVRDIVTVTNPTLLP